MHVYIGKEDSMKYMIKYMNDLFGIVPLVSLKLLKHYRGFSIMQIMLENFK